jgi:hypothetical protein
MKLTISYLISPRRYSVLFDIQSRRLGSAMRHTVEHSWCIIERSVEIKV